MPEQSVFVQKLNDVNSEVLDMQKKRDEFWTRKHELELAKGELETRIKIGVYDEIDPQTQKPLYGNESRRLLAIDEKLRTDEKWNAIRYELEILNRQILDLDTRLEYKRHLRRSIELEGRLCANRQE